MHIGTLRRRERMTAGPAARRANAGGADKEKTLQDRGRVQRVGQSKLEIIANLTAGNRSNLLHLTPNREEGRE